MEEAYALARSKGVGLSEDLVDALMKELDTYPLTAKSSQLQDLEAGRRLELEDLNGAAVRLGQELGIPTPVNSAVYAALKPYSNGPPDLPE